MRTHGTQSATSPQAVSKISERRDIKVCLCWASVGQSKIRYFVFSGMVIASIGRVLCEVCSVFVVMGGGQN